MATRVGATHFVNSAEDDPVKAVRALTGGAGVDHAFEAVGSRHAGAAGDREPGDPRHRDHRRRAAARCDDRVPVDGDPPRMPGADLAHGLEPVSAIDIPLYLDFYRQGRLDLDEMVTRRGRLGDINEAFRAMKAGEVARTVLTFD